MGFQLIEATVSGAARYLVVFNCEAGFEFESEDALREWLWSAKQVREPGTTLPAIDISSPIRLLSQRISVSVDSGAGSLGATGDGSSDGSGSGGSLGGPPSMPPLAPPASLIATISASGKRKFYRFSPFNPDRRVTPGSGDFAPGTYATTDHDEREVPSGFAAVGRYALPSTASAIHVYECTPTKGTVAHVGTVAPAYGQAGGGVEALFPAGATNGAPVAPRVQPSE